MTSEQGGSPETAAMALFLGPEPWKVIGGTSGAPFAAVGGGPQGHDKTGSILILVESSDDTTGDRLPELLAECHGDLLPGGRVAVLARNRTYQYFVFLRSLLPGRRPPDELWQGGGVGPRSVLRAARDAGFAKFALFAVSPSAEDPQELRPLSWRNAWLTPAFLVTADKKGENRKFSFERVTQSIDRSVGVGRSPRAWKVSRVLNSSRGKSVALMEAGDSQMVIRVARSEAMRKDEARSHQVLRQLQSNSVISGRVPCPVLVDEIGGIFFFAQTHVKGVPLSTQIHSHNRPAYLREANEFLRAMNPGLPASPTLPVHDTPGPAVGEPMRAFVLRQIPDAGLRAEARALIEESLRGAESRLGVVHGDFGAGNILVTKSRISGVIDWEAARVGAPPVLDAFNYLDSTHRACSHGRPIRDAVLLLAQGDWPISGEMDFLKDFFTYCGVDFRFRKGFALLYLLFHIGPQLRFRHKEEGPMRRLEGVLQRLLV